MLKNDFEVIDDSAIKDTRLKDLIYTYLDECLDDLKEATITHKDNDVLINVIYKYSNMLINIKKVCINRNKF